MKNQNGKHWANEEIAITNGFDAFFSVFGHVFKIEQSILYCCSQPISKNCENKWNWRTDDTLMRAKTFCTTMNRKRQYDNGD